DNDPMDPGIRNSSTGPQAYNLDIWVELHNPLRRPVDLFNRKLKYNIYQLLISRNQPVLPRGEPGDPNDIRATVSDFGQFTQVLPAQLTPSKTRPQEPVYADVTKTNRGFFVLGPKYGDKRKRVQPTDFYLDGYDPNLPTSFQTADLKLILNAAEGSEDPWLQRDFRNLPGHLSTMKPCTVILHRLAYPGVPPNPL